MMEELQNLMSQDIPEGRQSIKDSHTNLEKVAEYCEANYFQADNKTQALEESKRYTTQSLASVAYQINTLAFNLLHLLDLQTAQLSSVESQVNHIAQTVSIHKEKVARREIGVLTTNKNTIRQHKILAPANQEKPIKYVRKPISYDSLDVVGHGVRSQMTAVNYSQTAPRPRRSSSSGPAGPAPTQKPPTPPAQQMNTPMAIGLNSSTLRRGDYRTPPAIAPPQLPSNYAPSYPVGSVPSQPPRRSNSSCSTLPAAVHTSHLMHQQLGHYRQGIMVPRQPEPTQHMSGHFGGHTQHPAVDPSVGQEMLPAPPPAMMAHTAPISTISSQTGGNTSPPLPPPPEELASPPAALEHGSSLTKTAMTSNCGRNSNEPAWAPANYLEKVIAIYDYQADKADELSFSENAVIYVIKKNDDGWYEGVMNGVQGLFPGNYVEPCM